MKGFWLLFLGLLLGYTVGLGAHRVDSSPPAADRDSVLLSRADLDQLSRAIDGLGRAAPDRIFRYEAEGSLLSLECLPGGEMDCRLETRARPSSKTIGRLGRSLSPEPGELEITPVDPLLTGNRSAARRVKTARSRI